MSNNHNQNKRIVSRLTEGSISKSIISLAFPMIVTNAFVIILELIDAFFVGRLGSKVLAAVTLGGVVMFFLATFGMGLHMGTIALISRAFGEGDFEKANRITVQSLYLGVVISLFLGIFGFLLSPFLLNFLGAKGEILIIGSKYLRILFTGLSAMFFVFLGNAIFQGAGDTVTPMKIGALITIINIILDPIMIFGLLGFPRLEASGAALATVISRSIGSVLMLFILLRGKHVVHIKLDKMGLDMGIIKKIFFIGFPGSIQMLLRSFSMVVLVKIAALFGSVVIAVYGIGGRLFHLFLFPGFGFGGAAATLVGQNLGADNPNRAFKSAWLASFYYLIFLVISGTLVFVFSRNIAAVFSQEQEFIRIGSVFFKYIAAGAVFLSSGIVFSRALQGAGDTVSPMVTTGISLYIIQIPLAYLLSNYLEFGENGIWIAHFAGVVINTVLITVIFFRGKWKHKKV